MRIAKFSPVIFVSIYKNLWGGPPLFPKVSGGHPGEGAEYPGKIVVIADAHRFGHGGNGQVVAHQQRLGLLDAPPGDQLEEGLPAGDLPGQAAQLGPPDAQLPGDALQGELFHVVLVQVQLQPLGVRALRGLDHPLQLDIGGQGLQQLGVGPQFLVGVLAELVEGGLQGLRSAGVPVQGGAGALPLPLDRRHVQKTAEDQIGQRTALVVQRHHRLADARVAAVELEALGRVIAPDLPGVALHAAPVALRQGVERLAERRVALEEIDIPPLGVQDIGGNAGEDVEVGQQPEQLLLVKEGIQCIHSVLRQGAALSRHAAESGGTPALCESFLGIIPYWDGRGKDFLWGCRGCVFCCQVL